MFGFDVSDTEEARRTVAADEVDGKAKPTVFIVDRPQPVVPKAERDAATRVMQPIEVARFRPPPPPLPVITGGTVRQRHTPVWPVAVAAAAVVCSVLALVL